MTQDREKTALREPQAPVVPPAEEHGPAPLGTLMVIGVLLLVTLAFWMLVLGIQQGRA
ncbi:hypothetical protein Dxin01_00364 [Deinococcus xinjiangensis]|uniref:Uncharacterized protein n=1 Tax=Deinococcus xinjiangensis TaxID=457454 RepID=A0ABP9V5S6_9DEIO